MNNPIQALAQMAMNRISSDPNFQRNPQAKAFMDIMQRGDVAQGEQMARNLCQSFGMSEQEALQQAKSFFKIPLQSSASSMASTAEFAPWAMTSLLR